MFGFKSKNTEVKEQRMQNLLNKDIILKAITELANGKPNYLKGEDLGCPETAKMWNSLIDSMVTEKRKNATNINKLLQQVTRMDIINDMIKSVNNQASSLHSMVASSEELSASIEEVTGISQEIASHTHITRNNVETGVVNIEKAMDFVIDSFEEIKIINTEMNQVEQKTEAINQIIDIVKNIANQTNLLALNAAIEAARAGEHGRGFAVVADEVRELADRTKVSVEQVQKDIKELQGAIDLSVKRINSTSAQLESGKTLVNDTIVTIQGINDSIQEIDKTVNQVAANAEEQAAVTESFTEGTVDISNESDYLAKTCRDTGLAIYEVSKDLDKFRLDLIQNRNFLKDADMMEVYKTDHLLWRWRVYNMLLGFEKVDVNVVSDYKNCGLGKWYYGIECDKIRHINAVKQMEKPHIELHQAAKDAAIAFNNGDIAEAERSLARMDECSVIVFGYIDEIKKVLMKD
ncbi:methyl-accepting chemotaxis protein [Desulfonispora thiosulfatigenes]|nr:methyl-accepting chemotaxis protein [Desulfonispora thiosulfatigenes]